ncbi:MAG TPA: ribonuclease III [Acidimicrobiia bacterium]|nr:ribonuclease III [Acidimicrobiia bacterium]
MTSLDDELGYVFANPELLLLSLSHRSVSADDPARQDNERLEFLGDAVLQLVVTDRLYRDYPRLAEGQMAKIRAALVSRPTLADVARTIDLGRHIELAQAEERSGGREKDSILADAMEAIIGAVYLDGGIEKAGDLIERLWGDRVGERAKSPGVKDYKTRLQEVLAKDGQKPEYGTEGTGPDHERMFTAWVNLSGIEAGRGTGRSKKEAEQEAARQALEMLRSGSH